ncbi:MAG: hypothetical protein ACP5JF_02030 [Candidatus Methanodesulfokora sp.]|jgi:chromatin segregation and condensation protein Rec8/ScpA/Scc1 (kleisin family)
MDFFQTIKFLMEKFMRDMDIAYAGRVIFSLSKELRIYASNLFYGRKEKKKRRYNKVERIIADVMPRRIVRRPVTADELKEAMYWALKRLKEDFTEENLVVKVENFSYLLESIYKRIIEVLSRKKTVSLREISTGREDMVDVFVSVLFLEMEGRVVTQQDDPFGEIYISLPAMG